jgi:hypothetical protein
MEAYEVYMNQKDTNNRTESQTNWADPGFSGELRVFGGEKLTGRRVGAADTRQTGLGPS